MADERRCLARLRWRATELYRNEPALLRYVLRAVAAARGESAEDLARSTTETARAFFGITDRA